MLARTNGFRIRYGFMQRTLDSCKANAMALKMIMMSNSHQDTLEKCRILLMLG